MKAIADTGFLVAFGNRNDAHHAWAVELAEQITAPLLTCEDVLAEAAFHLRNSALVLAFARDGLVRVAFDFASHLDHLDALARKYAQHRPDLADLCLIRMSELYPRLPILTVDRTDFAIFRRNKRDAIPVICPPIA